MMGVTASADKKPPTAEARPADPAFESFFRDNYRAIVRLAHSVVSDFHTAQDVAQEVFWAAHRRFPNDPEGAAGWIRVATVHTALNTIRSNRRRERRHQSLLHAGSLPSAEEAAVDRESQAELRQALARLPRRSAIVLVLRHGGMSYLEIAEALDVKVGQVGTMLRRAELALGKEMQRAPRP
jgi:RNA polymerase sigma factor (sigma-70 family)